MAKLLPIIFTLLCFSTLIANSNGLSHEIKTVQKNPKPITIFLFEVLSGPNATIFEVARSSISTEPTSFGIVYVGDNKIRAGPDPNSPQVGRAQGTVTTVGMSQPTDLVNYVLTFDAGKYKGSSLRVAGTRLIFESNQEIPIAGGTGYFRGARGYVLTSFVSLSPIGDTFTFSYQIYLFGVGI